MTEQRAQAQPSLDLSTPDTKLESVETYTFAPIKGYPMLHWRGKRAFTSTHYYPAQLKEIHGEEVNGWRNKLFWGDNLQVMGHLLKQFRGKIDLIYIDPPFDSKADYKKRITLLGQQTATEQSVFEDKQYTDIWSNDEYLQFMYERLALCKELLAPSGNLLLHCDETKAHHLRCILDEIFGPQTMRNEIIWSYESGGRAKNFLSKKHDTIYWYSKSDDYFFDADAISERRGPMKKNNMRRGSEPDGRVYYAITVNGKEYRYFEDDLVPPTDVWEISHLQQQDPERTGYPTQKPERLVERIVRGMSPENGIVFDGFMGSGTTQAVAMKTERRFIGADINLGAIQTATKRLLGLSDNIRAKSLGSSQKFYTGFELYNVNQYDVFRNPVQAKDLLLEALEVQTLEMKTVFDGEKDGRMVKIMPVNRISTRADLNELVAGFDYKAWERRQAEHPNRVVEKVSLICMGHEPDLRVWLELAVKPFKIDVEVVDILRDKTNLEFKRDSEARIRISKGRLVIDRFFPMNLLQKLSLQKDGVEDWRQLVESVLIDWNYDGAVLQPAIVDIADRKSLVEGSYEIPEDSGTIRVKITDLLSESWEGSVTHG
jgi:adenine-specific DNA-methyltransferase